MKKCLVFALFMISFFVAFAAIAETTKDMLLQEIASVIKDKEKSLSALKASHEKNAPNDASNSTEADKLYWNENEKFITLAEKHLNQNKDFQEKVKIADKTKISAIEQEWSALLEKHAVESMDQMQKIMEALAKTLNKTPLKKN